MKWKDAWRATLEQWAFRLLWVAVFGAAFSLPLGRVFLMLSMLTLLWRAGRGRGRLVFPFSAWCWLAFAGVAVLASAFGINPALSFRKIIKLLWFMGIPVAATLATSRGRVLSLLRAYVYGACVLSGRILVLRVWEAWQAGEKAVAAGKARDLWWQIIDRGSMTHGQVLMVALAALAGLLAIASLTRQEPAEGQAETAPVLIRLFDWLALAALTAALVVNFKRGSWAVAGGITLLFFGLTGRWRRVALLLVAIAAMVMLPPVQRRLMDLHSEFSLGFGGRLVMWTKIAPTLIREHPFGLGYRALDEKLMQETAQRLKVRVEANRNHLHSNLLQITASLGWAGLGIYLLWMGRGLVVGIRQCTVAGADPVDRTLALTLTLMLAGLFLNGLVEYNYGDAELVLVYGLLCGLLEAKPAA